MSNWLDKVLELGKKYGAIVALVTALGIGVRWVDKKYDYIICLLTNIEVGTWYDFGMAEVTHKGLIEIDGIEVKAYIGKDLRGGQWIWIHNGHLEQYRIDYDSLTYDFRFLDANKNFEHIGNLDGLKEIK